MKGFDSKFKDLPDFILKITHHIWEEKNVESIREYYADIPSVSVPTPTRAPSGVIYGAEPVVQSTYAALKMFPDRQLLGEDVIWIGNDEEGYFSSHRILSTVTHINDGIYGKASGKKLVYRGIADCACKNNQVYDEWLVRDQGAIVRQLGIDPKKFAHDQIIEEGGPDKASEPLNENTPFESIYVAPKLNHNIANIYSDILKEIMNGNAKIINENYDRAVQQFQPGGFVKYGWQEVIDFWTNLKNSFPNAVFNIDHISFTEQENQPKKAAIRWSLIGKHDGEGYFGKPTGANIYILGINHAEFGPYGIKNEWILFDETMIWKQIIMKAG